MKIEFGKSFEKSLDKINNKSVYPKILKTIIRCEQSKTLSEILNVGKLTGYKTYFKIRIGEYRIGFELIDKQTIRFI